MQNVRNISQWQIVTWLRILFALHLIYSGGAYVFLGYLPSVFNDEASSVGRFLVALDGVGLYPFVKYMELILGLMVFFNLFVPLAATAELPITVVIFFLNVFVAGPIEYRHLFTGTQELFLNAAVMVSYGAYYRTMLHMKTRPQWLWNELDTSEDKGFGQAGQRALPIGQPATWAFFIGFLVIVLSASWFLGTVERRLPPRDYVPPVLAFVTMLILFHLNRQKGDTATA